MKCCIDYYHKTNIEDTEKDLGDFFYFPKVIKPVKISASLCSASFCQPQSNFHYTGQDSAIAAI